MSLVSGLWLEVASFAGLETITSYTQIHTSGVTTSTCLGIIAAQGLLSIQRTVLLDDGTPYALEIFGTEAQIHFPHR